MTRKLSCSFYIWNFVTWKIVTVENISLEFMISALKQNFCTIIYYWVHLSIIIHTSHYIQFTLSIKLLRIKVLIATRVLGVTLENSTYKFVQHLHCNITLHTYWKILNFSFVLCFIILFLNEFLYMRTCKNLQYFAFMLAEKKKSNAALQIKQN